MGIQPYNKNSGAKGSPILDPTSRRKFTELSLHGPRNVVLKQRLRYSFLATLPFVPILWGYLEYAKNPTQSALQELLMPAGLFFLLFWLVTKIPKKRLTFEKQLVRDGQSTVAEVIGLSGSKTKIGYMANGEYREAEHELKRIEPLRRGDTITLLYDPSEPSHTLVYEDAAYRVKA